MTNLLNLDKKEEEIIAKLIEHPFFKDLEKISHEKFLHMLFQRRFFSLEFTKVYDMVIDGLKDIEAKKIVRKILREEYPDETGNESSHREHLITDLMILHAKREDILISYPTIETTNALNETYKLLQQSFIGEFSDIKLLAIIRFWGEVLVSVEYGEYWKRMHKYFFTNTKNPSRFYYPHYCHDEREPLQEHLSLDPTHSGEVGTCLRRLLKTEDECNAFLNTESEIVRIKMMFYDQFLL